MEELNHDVLFETAVERLFTAFGDDFSTVRQVKDIKTLFNILQEILSKDDIALKFERNKNNNKFKGDYNKDTKTINIILPYTSQFSAIDLIIMVSHEYIHFLKYQSGSNVYNPARNKKIKIDLGEYCLPKEFQPKTQQEMFNWISYVCQPNERQSYSAIFAYDMLSIFGISKTNTPDILYASYKQCWKMFHEIGGNLEDFLKKDQKENELNNAEKFLVKNINVFNFKTQHSEDFFMLVFEINELMNSSDVDMRRESKDLNSRVDILINLIRKYYKRFMYMYGVEQHGKSPKRFKSEQYFE